MQCLRTLAAAVLGLASICAAATLAAPPCEPPTLDEQDRSGQLPCGVNRQFEAAERAKELGLSASSVPQRYAARPIGLAFSPWAESTATGPNPPAYPLQQRPCELQPSACFRLPITGHHAAVYEMAYPAVLLGQTRGFPLNMNVFAPPRTTNYAPLAQAAGASTAPLVSDTTEAAGRPLFLNNRETIAGVVDAITGQPLLREVDLELPLGRATYRMIRTYGGNATGFDSFFSNSRDNQILCGIPSKHMDQPAQAKYWDWAGTGWMMSENPILIFDAKYLEHDALQPRRCYLILDAHHSIPFTQDVQTGNYAAPAWFDATLTWESEGPNAAAWSFNAQTGVGDWAPGLQSGDPPRRPPVLHARLFGGSIHYTFRVVYDDMPNILSRDPFGQDPGTPGISAHLAPRVENGAIIPIATCSSGGEPGENGTPPEIRTPSDPASGFGFPYYALVERIEDRYGNRAVMSYTPQRFTAEDTDPNAPSGSCKECTQNCTEKGQLRTVKLFTAGQSDQDVPEWTLLYVHRSFRHWQPELDALRAAYQGVCAQPEDLWPSLFTDRDRASRWFQQNAVHAVYVYQRENVAIPTPAGGSWTLPAEAFVFQSGTSGATYQGLVDLDTVDWEAKVAEHLQAQVPSGWKYRLRYTYDEVFEPLENRTIRTDPDPVPDIVTAFGQPQDLPRIFRWGTPVPELSEITLESGMRLRRSCASLIRVEKTEDPSARSAATTSVIYTYATPLDSPHLWDIRKSATPNSAEFDALHHSTHPGPWVSPEVTPRLKHVIRQEGLARLAELPEHGPGWNPLNIFSPEAVSATDATPWNRHSYEEFATLTFEWTPLPPVIPHPNDCGLNSVYQPDHGPWMTRLVSEECVLNKVARERIIRSPRMDSVSRFEIRGSADGHDGIYDVLLFQVAPADFNNSGTVTVQDIFDFLACYFNASTVHALDDAMHRVQSILISDGVSTPARLAEYDYYGAASRAGMMLGSVGTSAAPAVTQTFRAASTPSAPVLPGLDAFGQVADLKYLRNGSTDPVWQAQHGYDRAGNRTYELVTAAAGSSGTLAERSWLFAYDGLDRLRDAKRGTLAFGSQGPPTVASPLIQQTWALDGLANWTGHDETTLRGFREDRRESGVLVPKTHFKLRPNQRNEIDAVESWKWESPDPGNEPEDWQVQPEVKYTYDLAGRLIYDGAFVYDYDFFGRLVQVRRAGGVTANQTGGTLGNLSQVGQVVAHYSYDGLGRLIRTQRPESGDGDTLKVTDLFYDGARVVQEVTILAVPAVEAGTRPDSSIIYAPRRADAFGDHDQNASTPDLAASRRLEREYVWAIDPHGYIDECHAQLVYTQAHPATPTSQIPSGDGAGNDLSPTVLYCLTSANKTVAALTDSKGDVVAQYGFTPYGEVRSVDLYAPPNDGSTAGIQASYDAYAAAEMNCLGHQGLRFERYDRPWLPPMVLTQLPDSSLGGFAGLYHNRNRPYEPRHGRFNSRDPNGLAGPILEALTSQAQWPDSTDVGFNINSHFNDGLNTHAAYHANPQRNVDPEGLLYMDLGISTAIRTSVFGGPLGALAMGYQTGGIAGFLATLLSGGVGAAIAGEPIIVISGVLVANHLWQSSIFGSGLDSSAAGGGGGPRDPTDSLIMGFPDDDSPLFRINVTPGGWQHVMDRHGPGSAQLPRFSNKSQFTVDEGTLRGLIGRAGFQHGRESGGNIVRTWNAGMTVGVDRTTGQATSQITVVTTRSGDLITAHPGAPSR